MAVFFGEHDQTIDAKHRLAISAALREGIDPGEDGKNFVLILGPDRHLWLYPDLYYRRLLGSLKRSPFPTTEQRKSDVLFAMARVVKPDTQGRIVLPEKSMQRAIIADQVTLLGIDDHIEIWPANEWQSKSTKDEAEYEKVFDEAARQANAACKQAT